MDVEPLLSDDEPASAGSTSKLFDPLTAAEPKQRRRGRKPGTTKPIPGKVSIDVKTLSTQLVGVHLLLGQVIDPAMVITEDEAKLLAKSIADIIAEYSLEASKRVMLWGGLITTLAIIYGPRLILIARNSAQKRSKKKNENLPKPSAGKFDFSGVA